jgi:hypothetical protein
MTLNICCTRGEAQIMSLIETIDLRYVKEETDFGTGPARNVCILAWRGIK